MDRFLRESGVRLVFAYLPGYNQVHDLDSPMVVRDALRDGCAELGIPFLDLTGAFRQGVEKDVLHLAPLDFHLTPAGNRVLAEAIAAFLMPDGAAGLERGLGWGKK